jgi:acyl carrier protein
MAVNLRSETLQKVTAAIYEETGELATPEARIRTFVTDSLELASMIQTLEDITGKDIPDEDIQRLFTVQDIVNYLEAH